MDTTLLATELQYRTARSSGSGGQHVNKVETKVEAYFDVEASAVLTKLEKKWLRKNLSHRINKQGILQVAVEEKRSQHLNKDIATKKIIRLIKNGIKAPKVRKFRPIKADREKRLKSKKQRSNVKRLRGKVNVNTMDD